LFIALCNYDYECRMMKDVEGSGHSILKRYCTSVPVVTEVNHGNFG